MASLSLTIIYIVVGASISAHSHIYNACESIKKDGGRLFKATSSPSMRVYAVNCFKDSCPVPLPIVSVSEVRCVLVPEKKSVSETVVPEHWEEK
jgi:hypothetical protein